ncbi:MAG: hypothetical protein WAT71_11935 [Ignavibacteria bacterium]
METKFTKLNNWFTTPNPEGPRKSAYIFTLMTEEAKFAITARDNFEVTLSSLRIIF